MGRSRGRAGLMNTDLILWYAARIAALAAFVVLAGSLLTGMAIRTAYLSGVARNRAVVAVHGFLTWFWLPLILVHVAAIVLDTTAGIRLIDVVIPFQSQVRSAPGAAGAQLAVGLGTVGFLLLLLVGVTAGLRKRMPRRWWNAIHRLSYPMFVVFLFHAQLAGTDFSHAAISVAGWATLGALALLTLPRLAGGRMTDPDAQTTV
jgi:sulfoxide reductase heme-binding subunit YedZ